MKKITLLFFALLATSFGFAQEDCATAVPVTSGATNTTTINAGNLSGIGGGAGTQSAAWYSYTPAGDGTIDVSACLGGSDTRLYIHDNCAGPSIANNDDSCPFAADGSGSSYASEVTGVAVTGGTTYYVEWDDRWDTGPFDWSLTFIPAPLCTPPAGTAVVGTTDCGAGTFMIDVDVTALGDGTPGIFDGTTVTPIVATGITSVGPYAAGSSITLTLQHGTDTACDLDLGTYQFNCPPANDLCAGAISLTVGTVFTDNPVAGQTNLGATDSGELPLPGCAQFDPADASGNGGDVWFSAEVPANGILVLEANADPTGGGGDAGGAVYSGDCGALVLVECDDDDSPDGLYPLVSINDMALAGQTVYFRVWEYNGDGVINFQVSAYSPIANDECAGAEALTLGVEVTADNTGATDSLVTGDCFTGDIADLWYSFVAGAGLEVEITTTAAQFAVYSDCAGTLVGACNSTSVVGLVEGTTYYVRVNDDGLNARSQAPGAFTLTVAEPTASLDQFNADSLFTYYPNPVNDNLTLKAQKEISNVSVYNMIGQEVYRNTPNTLTNEVNMTSLQAGPYFVKVTVGNVTETIKVIKN